MMEHITSKTRGCDDSYEQNQARWFAVSGDLDDFIFYDEYEGAYENTYISEK